MLDGEPDYSKLKHTTYSSLLEALVTSLTNASSAELEAYKISV